MSKVRFTLNILAVVIFTFTVSSLANAQATRTWVSGVGDDVNPCSRTAPCKTYAGAISKTARDGEISTLDPGGFGAVTITKSITINGTHGQGYGSILAALTTGVIINITDAADTRKTVRLTSLNINGVSSGTDGIRINSAINVFIEDTIVDGFTNRGINDIRSTAGSTNKLIVADTQVRNTVQSGIVVIPTLGASVTALLSNVRAINSTANTGYAQSGNVKGTIRDSFFAGNSAAGVFCDGTGGELTIVDSAISNNGTGINVASPGVVRILNSTINNNTTSIPVAGQGQVQSNGNNSFTGNSTNNLPTGPGVSSN
jgi:hypothetical protein